MVREASISEVPVGDVGTDFNDQAFSVAVAAVVLTCKVPLLVVAAGARRMVDLREYR